MKKAKMIIEFLKISSNKNKKRVILEIIWTLLAIPALIIHELCHLIFIYLTLCKHKILFDKLYYLKIDKQISFDDVKETYIQNLDIQRFNFPISIISSNPFKIILISLAPLLGIGFYIFFTIFISMRFTHNIIQFQFIWDIFLIYLIVWFRVFYLSQDDINAFKKGISIIKEKYFTPIK